jgi:stearoyl-CoA desaturase (delta-9 desaturase)
MPLQTTSATLLLVALSGLIVLACCLYYASNRRLRFEPSMGEVQANLLDIVVGTGLLTFLAPAGSALLLGPVLYVLLAQPGLVSIQEDCLYLTAALAGGFIALAGCGIHATGRSIDRHVVAWPSAPAALRSTAALYHGPLGHYPTHFGWSLGTAAVACLAAAHPPAVNATTAGAGLEVDAGLLMLLVAAMLHGLVRAASVLDGQTWRFMLPLDLILSGLVLLKLAQLSISGVALYSFVALATGPLAIVLWAVRHRGFPATAPGRQRRLADEVTPEQAEHLIREFEAGAGRPEPFVPTSLANKLAVGTVVVLPAVALVWAVVQLWQHGVDGQDLALLGCGFVLTSLGITVGYHRLLTHRSFKARPVVRFVLLVLGSMAVEGAAINWAAAHLKHHALADRDGDPHSPVRSLVWAHLGWLFNGWQARPETWGRHLLNDRMVVFVHRTFLLWAALGLLIPYLIGGWQGLLWGGLVRVFFVHHVTWSVNSICHTFGRQTYASPDRSANNWLVALLGMGEGWHNNHHAFPRSAVHGLDRWQIDLSAWVIQALEASGLVEDVQRVTPEARERRRLRHHDASTRTLLEPSRRAAVDVRSGATGAAEIHATGVERRFSNGG